MNTLKLTQDQHPFQGEVAATRSAKQRHLPLASAEKLLTPEALGEIKKGAIPDLTQTAYSFYETFFKREGTYSAHQFLPVIAQISLNLKEINQVMRNASDRHVLVHNKWMKMVLIRWAPGEVSNIHGHPSGGCVFKVLHGCVEEKRFTPDEKKAQLSVSSYKTGSIAYIDDSMAYHTVGNPSMQPAISLHVYTPGQQ